MSKDSSPRPRQRLKPEERRAQLLKCAVEAYALSGVERAGHGDIAKIANVSTATVFNYFPTRADLTEAVFTYICNEVIAMFQLFPRDKLSTAEEIKSMSVRYAHIVENDPNMVKVFKNWASSFNPEVRPYYLTLQKHVLEYIESRLPQTENIKSDARIIMASADMLALMKLDGIDPISIDKFIDRVVHVLS